MKLFDYKLIFIAITILLCLPIFLPTIYGLLPKREQETFFSLGILGKKGIADNYYQTEEATVIKDILNEWKIYVYSNMKEVKQILIKVKLLEDDTDLPNISTCFPSPSFEVFEIRRIIGANQTLNIPFIWMITNITNNDINKSTISQIQINNYTREVNISYNNDKMVTILFELWVYDTNENTFQFHWIDFEEYRCVWAKLNFNISSELNQN